MYEGHEYFIKWAKQYEEGLLEGRNRIRHEIWLREMKCPVVCFRNETSQQALLDNAIEAVEKFL